MANVPPAATADPLCQPAFGIIWWCHPRFGMGNAELIENRKEDQRVLTRPHSLAFTPQDTVALIEHVPQLRFVLKARAEDEPNGLCGCGSNKFIERCNQHLAAKTARHRIIDDTAIVGSVPHVPIAEGIRDQRQVAGTSRRLSQCPPGQRRDEYRFTGHARLRETCQLLGHCISVTEVEHQRLIGREHLLEQAALALVFDVANRECADADGVAARKRRAVHK